MPLIKIPSRKSLELEFETSISEIDDQHRQHVNLLNQLARSPVNNNKSIFEEAFGALVDYSGYLINRRSRGADKTELNAHQS